MVKERVLVTAALPYTNNVPHLGNIVGSHFPADVFARYCRMAGYDVVFVGGADENGTASEIAAQGYGISPKELCDFFYPIHKQIYDWFQISYDNFSRTSSHLHYKTANEILSHIYRKGYIFPKTIRVPYCPQCKRELADRYIEGTCPSCNYEKARGDQCEICGTLLEPEKLKNSYCKVCGTNKIEFQNAKHLFLDLTKLSSRIKRGIEKNKQLRLTVKNLSLGWLKEGLRPRCITRNIHWGIPVGIKGFEHLKYYVWAEAVLGYISSTKEWDAKKWKLYWCSPKTRIYCFVGKDNIPFHTILFPGLLFAHGGITLPFNVVGVQYLNYERGKFSKSNNRGIFCENLPSAGIPSDYWRFYLAYIIPETKDTEFLWNDFREKINKELVGNVGNFVHRTVSFLNTEFNGQVPKPRLALEDKKFMKIVVEQTKAVLSSYEKVELRLAMEQIMKLSAFGNKYFQENEPWKDKERAKTVIYLCVNLSRIIALLLSPFIPSSSQKILKILGVKDTDFRDIYKFTIKDRHTIETSSPLFAKLEDKTIDDLKQKTSRVTTYFPKKGGTMELNEKVISTPKAGNYVPFEEWDKMKLRVGKVLKVEPHPNAEKLYVLLVDLGEGENNRQLVAGLREHYKPEELVGKQVVVFTNLQPRTIRGIESNGMVLAAEFKGKVVLLQPEKKIETGARIR